jgi:gamma-glutamyltranspeptidase/glutathione hydrolase
VHSRCAFEWADSAAHIANDANAARVLLPGGRPPAVGEIFRNPQLAQTLRRIAKEGRKAFYEGSVAEDIVASLTAKGGLHGLEDLAENTPDYVEPVRTGYRGHGVSQLPPNNQGITALIMLNILANFELAALKPLSAARLHLEIEAGRLAYRDRDAHVADPQHAQVPSDALLAPDYAAGLAARIDPERAMTDLPPGLMQRSDTVYLSVVDRDRNAVSFINSVYHSFGSGIMTPNTGIVLQKAPVSASSPAIPTASGRASGRCTRSCRAW